jgi:DNA ligase (NAD+)
MATYNSLKETVKKHCHLYYDLSNPEISDAEFDKLYDELVELEKAQGWKDSDSPTLKVGGSPGKVTHPYKLYSLRKVYNPEEVPREYTVKSPKIDGSNITVIYKNNKLALALTRGDGERGDDVTHLVRYISNLPSETHTKDLVVNGECVTDNDVTNFRNYVSGSLGLNDAMEFKSRNIKFIAHDLLGSKHDYLERIKLLSTNGFTTVMDESVEKYPTDGLVYRLNKQVDCMRLGYTSKYPRFAVALKTSKTNTVTTILEDVVWAVGRTGTVNPTGIIAPVVIEDATITRVTLHNLEQIEKSNLGLGDTIEIERAGGVIPKFLKVVKHSEHNNKITINHAEKYIGKPLVRAGPKLRLESGEGDSIKYLENYISVMNIRGLGPASVAKMKFTHPTDLYKEDINWNKLGANGIKVRDEVKKSKLVPYSTVLAALGIPGVGKSTAKLIVAHIPSFHLLKEIEYTNIKDIGGKTIKGIIEWLHENEEWVLQLPVQLEEAPKTEYDDKITTVCISGKLDMTKADMQALLTEAGYEVLNAVTKKCDILLSDGNVKSLKYQKALSLGIKIVNYWDNRINVLKGKL